MFEYDEVKRVSNLDKHGVDLLYAALIFEGPVLTVVDDRTDYGERRLISLGLVGDGAFVVVHTEREGNIRLISAWRGGRKAYERYKGRFPD
jgi:uncharacterized DUF497 family protein